jgi:hypothetical protein
MHEEERGLVEQAWRRCVDTFRREDGLGFYDRWVPGAGPSGRASLWNLGALLGAAAAVARVDPDADGLPDDLAQLAATLDRHRRPRRPGLSSTPSPDGDTYYDDNAWVGLAAVELGATDPGWQLLAEETYAFLQQGVDPESGGVFWRERPRDTLHVCSTGPTLLLGALLRERRPTAVDPSPLRAMWRWLSTMQAPDGRFWDHRQRIGGLVDRTFYTYNTGAPLHALAVLNGMGDFDLAEPLHRAVAGAGRFLDGRGQLPATPWFNAVLLRGLEAAKRRAGLDSPAWPACFAPLEDGLRRFRRDPHGPLSLYPPDGREGLNLRQAAAAVETLARRAASTP